MSVKRKEERLSKIVKQMDVPDWKRSNLKWLKKKLGTRNSEHQFFEEAMELIDDLLHEKNLVKQKQ